MRFHSYCLEGKTSSSDGAGVLAGVTTLASGVLHPAPGLFAACVYHLRRVGNRALSIFVTQAGIIYCKHPGSTRLIFPGLRDARARISTVLLHWPMSAGLTTLSSPLRMNVPGSLPNVKSLPMSKSMGRVRELLPSAFQLTRMFGVRPTCEYSGNRYCAKSTKPTPASLARCIPGALGRAN